MKKLAIGLMTFLLCFSNSVFSKEWSEREKQIYTFYAAAVIGDSLQSWSAMQDPCECFKEANPVFGHSISDEEILLATVASLWGMHWMIEQDAPEWLLWSITGMRWTVVVNNHHVGARIRLDF